MKDKYPVLNDMHEMVYNALERKLPEGWVIRCRNFPSHVRTFNPKLWMVGDERNLSELRIDLLWMGISKNGRPYGDWRIKFHTHRSRRFNRKNVEHFATLVADEAQRLEPILRDKIEEAYYGEWRIDKS